MEKYKIKLGCTNYYNNRMSAKVIISKGFAKSAMFWANKDSSTATSCIVGRVHGSSRKHENAAFTIYIISFCAIYVGAPMDWSKMSFNLMFCPTILDAGGERRICESNVMISDGCFSIKTSNIITPKL